MKNILITGGSGYIGSVLVPKLLELGYDVTVIDDLIYSNGYSLINNIQYNKFEFVKGDIRDKTLIKSLITKADCIIHLAAIVGYPACEKNKELATSVNEKATINISKMLSNDQLIICSSTGSNYGEVIGEICTEETKLNPLSHYGKTKTIAELHLLNNNKTIVFRFATAFGLSPRMRMDLLINDFVYQAVVNKYLLMFEKDFKRTFINIQDIAKSFLFAIDNAEDMSSNIYNVGDEINNYAKEDIALMIKSKIDYYLHFAEFGEDLDKRNYEVSYDKIKQLGFRAEVSTMEGIDELIKTMPLLQYTQRYRNA